MGRDLMPLTHPDPVRAKLDSHDELVLDQIRDYWDTAYDTRFAGGLYHAHRLTGGPLLTAATPGGLAIAIWDDWTAR